MALCMTGLPSCVRERQKTDIRRVNLSTLYSKTGLVFNAVGGMKRWGMSIAQSSAVSDHIMVFGSVVVVVVVILY